MSTGMTLAGIGQAAPQLQQIQEMQQKRAQGAAIANALKQYAGQQGGASGQPGMAQPGAAAPTSGGLPATPGASPQAGGQPGFSNGQPNIMGMMDLLSKSGLPADQQYDALKEYGAFASPFEKMMNQLDMKQMQLSNTSSMLSERLQAMRDIAGARDATTRAGQNTRADTADSTRDTTVVEKELADQRALLTGMLASGPKVIDSPEYKAEKQKYDTLQKELSDTRRGGSKPGGAKGPAQSNPAGSAGTPAGGASAPSAEDTDYLKANPDQAANFDSQFGKGSAAKILGQ